MKLKLLAIIIASCVCSFAYADQIKIEFVTPTQYVDGSPLASADIKEYEIQRAPSTTGSFVRVGNAAGGANKTHVFSDAPTGAQCYRLITVAVSGRRSDPSEIKCVNTSPPKSPTGVTLSVTVTVSTP